MNTRSKKKYKKSRWTFPFPKGSDLYWIHFRDYHCMHDDLHL